ncbi:MAG: NADH-quinone oxidoreductase subunit L [Planctomycetes bacterium]|nr:NADH-quinone oxidoreductase subunit L [Planctomycetota bacterium]
MNALNDPIFLAAVALLAPIGAALLLVVLPFVRHRGAPAAGLCIFGSVLALAAAVKLLFVHHELGDARFAVTWISAVSKPIAEIGLFVDGTSSSMLAVVCLVALCVQVFSVAYMHDEPPRGYGRYFAYHAFFLFSMNAFVLAPNLLQAFAGWELVGLTSYLLIGFYFAKPSAAKAAVKAFWMTKLADMGFLFGLLWLFVATGGFEWTAKLDPTVAVGVTLLLFLAVVGKSAQFPLHIWLPDAMEGPTPVSALLHAATMVAAGVFLIVRADPLFVQAATTQTIMLWIGAFTAVFAACLALVQRDIKKVLAYSTCSQLGYMVAALGAGSAFAGYFHLGTHAFFKALLFLAAGSVIHAVHSNDLADMGGLRKKMPLTTLTFVIGALSLAGIPGLAGFFSKDLVLASLEGRFGWVPWGMLMFSAFLTAFYMGRVLCLAFFGNLSHKAEHAHEAPLSMSGPLIVLAVPSVVAGFFGSTLAHAVGGHYEAHFVGLTPIVASAMALAGLLASIAVYGRNRDARVAGAIEGLDRASAVDRLWELGYRRALLGVSSVLGWIDRYVIDGLMNFTGYTTIEAGAAVRGAQTGRMRHYLVAVVLGAVLVAVMGLVA